MSEALNVHSCPGCGVKLDHNARAPWRFCRDCLRLASDHQGRRVEFHNTSISGGLSWRYENDPTSGEPSVCVGCLILGREVLVSEARFGGIVAQPVNRELLTPALARGGTDLTR